MSSRTEDEVRDAAKHILGFDDDEQGVKQGTGQITTFNQLGFDSIKTKNRKPDGWYLPEDRSKVAIVLETKAEDKDLSNDKFVAELLSNMDVISTKYSKVIGLLYNGQTVRVYKNKDEVSNLSPSLQHKQYYIDLFLNTKIDTDRIYNLTRRINDRLHFDFRMNDLKDRMVFTACALVVQRFNPTNGLNTQKGQSYKNVRSFIANELDAVLSDSKQVNTKLAILEETFDAIAVADDTKTADIIIDAVCEISNLIDSNNWRGEDVMSIFFNEFTHYGGKETDGQVFTPEHIASLMYRLLDVNMNDRVLDATCGSGTFLTVAMSKMIEEAGGYSTEKAKEIMSNQLYGIEFDRKIYALACANMLIHKDGKTNLAQMDTRTDEACAWMKDKGITKVLMNPPYESKYGCMKIVKNVLDSVPVGTKCAFILPDKHLEKQGTKKDKTKAAYLLATNTLTTIVKLPENVFFGKGVTTSIFIFEKGTPQGTKGINAYYIADDGLETVKNKGRHDTKGVWHEMEDYWVKAIQDGNDYKFGTRRVINLDVALHNETDAENACKKYRNLENLSYPTSEKPFEICEEDFMKTAVDYELFKRGIDAKEFTKQLGDALLYHLDSIISSKRP
jgi:type I restriction-modification system DNA methylase subunit